MERPSPILKSNRSIEATPAAGSEASGVSAWLGRTRRRLSSLPLLAPLMAMAACSENTLTPYRAPDAVSFDVPSLELPENCVPMETQCTAAGSEPGLLTMPCNPGQPRAVRALKPNDTNSPLLYATKYGLFVGSPGSDILQTRFIEHSTFGRLQTYTPIPDNFELSDRFLSQMHLRDVQWGARQETVTLSLDNPNTEENSVTPQISVTLDVEDPCWETPALSCTPLFIGQTNDLGTDSADGPETLIRFGLEGGDEPRLHFWRGPMPPPGEETIFSAEEILDMPLPQAFVDVTTEQPRVGDFQMAISDSGDVVASFRFVMSQEDHLETPVSGVAFLERNVFLAICHASFDHPEHTPHCELVKDPNHSNNPNGEAAPLYLGYFNAHSSTPSGAQAHPDAPIMSSGIDQVHLEPGVMAVFASDGDQCNEGDGVYARPNVHQNSHEGIGQHWLSDEERESAQNYLADKGCGPTFEQINANLSGQAPQGRVLIYELDAAHGEENPLVSDSVSYSTGPANSLGTQITGFPYANTLGLEDIFPGELADEVEFNHIVNGWTEAFEEIFSDPPILASDGKGHFILNVSDDFGQRWIDTPHPVKHSSTLFDQQAGTLGTLEADPFLGIPYCLENGLWAFSGKWESLGQIQIFEGIHHWSDGEVVIAISTNAVLWSEYREEECTGLKTHQFWICPPEDIESLF